MSETQVNGGERFTDAAAQQSLRRAMQTGLVIAVVALPLFWWKTEWRGAVEFAAGAAISLSGIRDWRRLMTVLMERLAAADSVGAVIPKPKAVLPILVGFFLRLVMALAVLYGSLKYLNGSVIALVAGLAIGVIALTIEAVRLLKSWTE